MKYSTNDLLKHLKEEVIMKYSTNDLLKHLKMVFTAYSDSEVQAILKEYAKLEEAAFVERLKRAGFNIEAFERMIKEWMAYTKTGLTPEQVMAMKQKAGQH